MGLRGKWVNLSERRGVPLRLLKKEIPFLEVAAEILLPVKCTGKGLKGWGVVHVLTKRKCIIKYGKRGDKILSPFRTKYSRQQSQVPHLNW